MNTKIELDTYATLWSPSQKKFHSSTVKDMLERNTRICLKNKAGDYITLAFHNTPEEARSAIASLRRAKNQEG
jgi:hypothetical protein